MPKNRLIELARNVLESNWREGFNEHFQLPYGYTAPSLVNRIYPHQWLWDSCFHAIVWSHLEPERAERELVTLLSRVDRKGLLPHMIVWERGSFPGVLHRKFFFGTEHSNRFTQPPVIAIALERVYQTTGNRDFLEQTLPAALRVYNWLAQERDPDGDGLVSLISPVESGADQSPVFDHLFKIRKPTVVRLYAALHWDYILCRLLNCNLRKIQRFGLFNIEEIGFNSILVVALRSLARLLVEVGETEAAGKIRLWADKAERSIIEKCFDSETGLFYSLAYRSEMMINEPTYASLMPLLLDGLGKDQVDGLVGALTDEERYWLPYPVPSVPKDNRSFDPSGQIVIWRGPTWININWFLVQGLLTHGHRELAGELERRSLGLAERSGFRECYNPLTGEGLRAKNFGWSTLVMDFLS